MHPTLSFSRRRAAAAGLVLAALIAIPVVVSAGTTVSGPMGFDPIPGSAYGQLTTTWSVPFIVPAGFSQHLVSDEGADFGGNGGLNVYAGPDDLPDMNTVNETGKEAGTFLYRTHEVGSDGAVSVVDLETGITRILAQYGDPVDQTGGTTWTRLDGIRWTPWKSVLFAEETTRGRLFEILLDPKDPGTALAVVDRPMVGRIAHEGIEVGPDSSIYVVDEFNGGSIYRFVPTKHGDLSSGQLYALKVDGLSNLNQTWGAYHPVTNPHTGSFEWVALDMSVATVDARLAADAVNATEYGRPEDLELIGQTLYVANTSENRVLSIELKHLRVRSFVEAGVNAPVENGGAGVTGFDSPDNLAEGPDGRLWIVEDNVPSDIWATEKDLDGDGAADGVHLFASMRDPGAEGTGLYFGKDSKTLFVNVQHAAKPLADGTWAIVKD
jgi:sugar lactone lactonase YvrE